MKSFTTNWNHVDVLMPLRHVYVLVTTPYCRCPFGAAFTDGINWISVDYESMILNVEYWCEIKEIPSDEE